MASHSRFQARGFTLVELISIIVVLGILTAIAASRFMAKTSFDADAFSDTTRALLRYGQKIAIGEGRNVYVRLDPLQKNIALCFDSGCTSLVPTPVGNTSSTMNCATPPATWYCAVLPSSVSYAVSPSNAYFFYDAKGKPYAPADSTVVEDSTLDPLTISISGDGITRSVTVERETGYVY